MYERSLNTFCFIKISFQRTLEPVQRVGLIWIFENYISITNGNTVAMHKSDLTTLLRKKY